MSQHDSLLKQAIELAQANKRAEARQLILKVVNQDENNARAWMLLARVTTDLNERRTALLNVVNLEPYNIKAQEALAQLEGQLAISRAIGEDPLKPPRRFKLLRTFIVLLLAVMALTILGVIVLIAVRTNEVQIGIADLTQSAREQGQTTTAIALIAGATETATVQIGLDMTATYEAGPTATNTPRPTLPPELTSTPTITPTPSVTPVPSPEGLSGTIIGWGGRAAVNDGYFPVIFISMRDGSIREVSSINRGDQVAAVNTERVVYRRFFRDFFINDLSTVVPSTAASELLSLEIGETQQQFSDGAWPQFTPDGRWLVFVATSDSDTRQVYLYDTAATADKIRRLTNDNFDYDMPTISPDGRQVVAVRRNRSPSPPNVDLALIDVGSGAVEPWTGDGDDVSESMPRWSPDGQLVAYVTDDQNTGNRDIHLRTTTGFVNVINVTRSPDIDEIHPVFSPDTRYLAYASDFAEGYNIFLYDLLTGGFYQLTYDNEEYYPGAWVN